MFERTPAAGPVDESYLSAFDDLRALVVNVRGVRAQRGISPKEELSLNIEGDFRKELLPVLMKAANLSSVEFGAADGPAVSFIVGTIKALVKMEGLVDTGEERRKLEADLEHQRKFLAGVRAKLSNGKFISGAPAAVVEGERKKESDALARIAALEASLSKL